MTIHKDIKDEIRCFVYFLFKGSLSHRLINKQYDYLELLLNNPEYLFNCFRIYSHCMQASLKDCTTKVVDYLIALHEDETNKDAFKSQVVSNNEDSIWRCFLELSDFFCSNTFENKIQNFKINDLNGNGTDALSAFIIWTNIIEVDEQQNVLNAGYALKRANEKLRFMFDDVAPVIPFSEQEYEADFH